MFVRRSDLTEEERKKLAQSSSSNRSVSGGTSRGVSSGSKAVQASKTSQTTQQESKETIISRLQPHMTSANPFGFGMTIDYFTDPQTGKKYKMDGNNIIEI